jgi:NADPH-dependent curcumin reductase CurA
MWSWL